MKLDLSAIFSALRLPAGSLVLFSAILLIFGIELSQVLVVVEGLVGTFALIALLINVLKWAGALPDGYAGYLSMVLNLVPVVVVAVVLRLYPTFDFASYDAMVADFANVAIIVFAYIVQIVGSKSVHIALSRGIIPSFSYSLPKYSLSN